MFKGKTVYKLKDPKRYDDDYGTGYDHVETYYPEDGYSICDCWVTNARGDIHPGYKDSPMPICFGDVEPVPVGPERTTKNEARSCGADKAGQNGP